MALVRLTKGGGGGELHGAEIKATIDESSFATKIVYLYKGESATPTDRKTFPSTPTSGVYTVTFTVQEVGTYRIYSVDDDNNEASESKTISSDDIVNKTSYTVELTTGFNYKKWINYGSTDNYPLDVDDYSSLAEVLADEKAVRQLMTVHDSADYFTTALIDDTDLKTTILASDNALKWIGLRDYTYDKLPSAFVTSWLASDKWEYALKDHVPVMTSNTAPYGSVIEVGSHSNYTNKGFQAFDGNSSTFWADANGDNNDCIGYNFVNPICVKRFYLVFERLPLEFVLEASNDGFTTKEELWSVNNNTERGLIKQIDNNKYFMSYRFRFVRGDSGNGTEIPYTIQFYGRTLNVSVPNMEDATTPYGEAIGINPNASNGRVPYKAFDGDVLTNWQYHVPNTREQNAWVGYDFKKKIVVKKVLFMDKYSDGYFGVGTYKIEGSNTGNSDDWTPVTTIISAEQSGNYQSVNIDSGAEYRYWRMFIITSGGTNISSADLFYLNFFGVDYSQREFEENSNMHYIYDHGVEIESISVNGGTEKQSYQIYGSGNGFYAYTSDKIDFTDYSLMRAVSGDKLTRVWLVCGTVIPHDNVYTYEAQSVATEQAPYNCCLSTLLVNGEYYAEFGWYGSEQSMSISEWWLE